MSAAWETLYWETLLVRFASSGILSHGLLAGCCLWAAFALTVCAQNEPADEQQQPGSKATAPLESPAARTPAAPELIKTPLGPPAPPSELDTYLLRDSKGNLVPVIGLAYEDFEKLLQIQKGLQPPPPPAFSIDSLSAIGKAEGSTAELQVSANIRVRQDGWVRVPLRLGGGALLEPPKYQGPGEHVLNVAGGSEGYLLWLKGQDKPHRLQMRIATPITDNGTERRLQLSLPRGTESVVRLQVPLAQVTANLRNGSEGILSTKPLPGGQTEISVVGPTGELQVAWQSSRIQSPETRPTIDATGEIVVRVESRNRLSAEARLKLRAVGKPLEMVTVRLPPGMQLVPAPTTGYTVTPAEVDRPKPNQLAAVEVRFDRPTMGPVEVRLLAEQEVSPAAADIVLRPARFEVVGAQRQRGTLDFLVEGDWNLNWSDEGSTRRVELSEAPVGVGRPVARFEYFKQPLDLKLGITPRPTRIALEPQYQVFVDATQLRLEATFRFRIRGPKATSTSLDLAGWRIDNISGENTAEQPLPPADATASFSLPLTQMDLTKGELTYRIEAHQALPGESESLQFSLPRPQVDTAAPASIVVQPADNVELTPTVAELKGLVADTSAAVLPPGPRQQPPLLYRDLGSAEAITFVASRRVRARHTSVQAQTLVRLRRGPVEVEQKFDYQISYEGKRSYLFVLPGGVAEPQGLQILHSGQLLEHRPAPGGEAGQNAVEVVDSQARLGPVELTLRYSLPAPALKTESAAALHVPLIVPAESEYDRWLGQSIRIEHADELQLNFPNSPAAAEFLARERGALEGKTGQRLTALDFDVSLLQTPEISGLMIDRMWVQTWLSPQQRQERCALQVRTASPALAIRLPVALKDSNVQILVDGKGVPSAATGERTVRIELGPATAGSQRVIELWYTAPRSASSWWIADHRLTPPQIEKTVPQTLQWQVILPADEHLLLDPRDYAPEMVWAWRNYLWSRMAVVNQGALEKWCGATRQEPLPPSLNNYLFSTVGSEPVLHLRTMSQRAMAVWLAGLGLVLGLLILHVPQVRSPTGLLVLAIIFLALGIAAPQTMLFVAQLFAVGLVIVALLAALRWLWTGQVPAPQAVAARSPSNVAGPRSTGSRSAPPVTTAAGPVLPPATQEVEL